MISTLRLFVLFFVLEILPVRAQDIAPADSAAAEPSTVGPVVTAIAFVGNKHTEQEIMLREMTLRKGSVITEPLIKENESRLYNLGLFNTVKLSYPPMDSTVLIVEVSERWYLWPVPLVGIVDRDFSKWYYGAGVQHWNVNGRNEKLFAGGVFGYNPWASVAYSNPWIFGDAQLSTSTEIKVQQIVNKNTLALGETPEFDENHFYFNQVIGKRLNHHVNVFTRFGFHYLHVTDPTAGITPSDDGIERVIYAGFGATYDTRDINDYPMKGMVAAAAFDKSGVGTSDVDYLTYSAELKVYQPVVAGSSICGRVFGMVRSGPVIPKYGNVFFGFSERLRGHFKEIYEGHNIFGVSAEWRMPILTPRTISLPFVPVEQFQSWRFGLYCAAFFDAGTTWYKHDKVHLMEMPSGYGAGVHFLLPYGFVFRLEYAMNELGNGQFIYDMRASF